MSLLIDRLRALRADPSALAGMSSKQLADLKELHQRMMRENLEYWAENTSKHFTKKDQDPTPVQHHRIILYWLNELFAGRIKRLMISLPPGSAKSTYAVRVAVPWFMANHARNEVLLISSSQKLVWDHSDEIRKLMNLYPDVLGIHPMRDSRERWDVSNNSKLLAIAAGQDFQGFRGDLIIGDDLIGGVEDVKSDLKRDGLWDWFDFNVMGRVADEQSRICIINTRWHADDLNSRILTRKSKNGEWVYLNLPAYWEEDYDEPAFPQGCGRPAFDPEFQKYGAPLWPAVAGLYAEARDGSELKFQAQYQGKPLPPGGAIFHADLLKPTPITKKAVKTVRAWDFASSRRRGADFTASVKMQVDAYGHYTVLNRTKFQGDPSQVRAAVMQAAEQDGASTFIAYPKDPGQAGAWQSMDITAALAGYKLEVYPAANAGNKEERAQPFAAQVNGENVSYIIDESWNNDFIDELRGFPNLGKDDQVDAASLAFGSLLMLPQRNVKAEWSHGGIAR